MSGEVKSATARLADIEDRLDTYEKEVGLTLEPRVSMYLNVTQAQMKAMSAEECEEAAFDLANYGIYLQKEINKHIGRVGWAESNIKPIIARECNNVRAPSYEERKLLVIANNEAAFKLEEIRLREQMCLDRLNFMNRRVDVLAERFSKLQESKQRRNKYG